MPQLEPCGRSYTACQTTATESSDRHFTTIPGQGNLCLYGVTDKEDEEYVI